MTKKTYLTLLVVGMLLVVLGLSLAASQPAQASVAETAWRAGPSETEPLLPAALTGPVACSAQPASYQSTFIAVKDSYINSASPDTNYGTDNGLTVGHLTFPATVDYRALVAFDLSALPADAVILTATLELYQASGSGFNVMAQALTASWTEGGVTWNNQPTFITQDQVVEDSAVGSWRRWDLTPIAQKWHAGTLDNYGARLIFNFGTNGSRVFYAREGDAPPRLVVNYQRSTTLLVQADTYISEANPSVNYGSEDTLSIGRNVATLQELHGLLKFDVSGVPADSVIVSATLGLYPYVAQLRAPEQTQAALTIAPETVLADWVETSVTWNARPTSLATGDPSSAVVAGNWTWWDVTNIVQGWTSGTFANYGILLKPTPTITGTATFNALPKPTHAKLIVTYGPPCDAINGVTLSGPRNVSTGTLYAFTAVVSPSTATPPFNYIWEASDQSPVDVVITATSHHASFSWADSGVKIITVTVKNCGNTVVMTHALAVNAVSLIDVPLDVHRRAARFLEETRGTDAAPGWGMAQLGQDIQPLYRPDIAGVAYYEFPVVIPSASQRVGRQFSADQLAGFIIVSASEHDYPVPHWSADSDPPTHQLAQLAAADGKTAAKFYKLDALAYAAEDAAGERVSTLGAQPFKITGMDPAWLDNPPAATHSEWIPTLAMTDDLGAGQITSTFTVTGPTPPPTLQFSAWASWDEMKTGYSDSYGVLAEMTRRNASELWEAESAIRQYGEPLFKGQSYVMALLWPTPTIALSGPAAGFVQTDLIERNGLAPLYQITVIESSLGQAVPFTASISYQNGVSETVGFIVVELYNLFLPLVTQDADPMTLSAGSAQPIGAQDAAQVEASPWSYWYAGTDADQCWYQQIPKGESPNTSACTSGCGPTAWAMLFCWVDNQAEPAAGNEYWQGRWGLYQFSGINYVAPKVWGAQGPKDMTWEIRNDANTWCSDSNNAPTNPWDMDGASKYINGRSAIRLSAEYSVVGYGWDYIMLDARESIREKQTPVVIGIGWLEHYPLAYGYRRRTHTYCVVPEYRIGCVTTREHQFLANMGWGGTKDWVATDIWYSGRLFPRSAWNDDVGLYSSTTRKWYYDYDHNGNMDQGGWAWGSAGAFPVVGDFNRDGVLGDIALYEQSTGIWSFDYNHDRSQDKQFTLASSNKIGLPIALDFDRDGFVDDIGLYYPATGWWCYDVDTDNSWACYSTAWGLPNDLPIAGDFDNDGFVDDVARYHPSTNYWYYDYDHDRDTDAIVGPWGLSGDLPIAGDFDKDGFMDDVALYRPSDRMWYYDYDHNGHPTDAIKGPWGGGGVRPIAGNFETR